MKKFTYNFLDPHTDRAKKEEVFREIDNLRQLNHPNIANIVDLVLQNNAPVVVMELCDGSL
jgi:serine/threonine protein kinase